MQVPGIQPDRERGTRIKRAREAKHLTQPELAEIVGVSRFTISNWERGKTLNHPHLRVLGDAVGRAPGYLLTGEDAPDDEVAPEQRLDELSTRISRLEIMIADRLSELEDNIAETIGGRIEDLGAEVDGLRQRVGATEKDSARTDDREQREAK